MEFNMFNNYPCHEKIWYIQNLMYRSALTKPKLSEEESLLCENIKTLLRDVDKSMLKLREVVDQSLDEEQYNKIREELDPFARAGQIYMGAGHFSEYGCNRLHEYLAESLDVVGWLQQGGLQGAEFDNDETLAQAQEKLRGFLTKLAEKIGVTDMTFENSPK